MLSKTSFANKSLGSDVSHRRKHGDALLLLLLWGAWRVSDHSPNWKVNGSKIPLSRPRTQGRRHVLYFKASSESFSDTVLKVPQKSKGREALNRKTLEGNTRSRALTKVVASTFNSLRRWCPRLHNARAMHACGKAEFLKAYKICN